MARQDANETFLRTPFLYGGNAAYIEELQARYEKDPNSVDAEWRAFFAALKDESALIEKNARGASWRTPNWPIPVNGELVSALDGNWAEIERAVGDKIKAKAQGNGIEVNQAETLQATRDSVRALMHISDPTEKAWLQERIEGPDKEITFTREGKRAILNKLVEAEGFEKFLDLKYTGTKRFGLDGSESLIPALEQIIKRGGNLGVKEIVLGMAHRGRLNVLTQVMGKPHRALFHEFKGGSFAPDDVEGSGDVKYHLGASSDRTFDGNNVHLSLTANPSHLEIVDPVVLGKVRAKQDQHGCSPDNRTCVMPLLIHGDAAFAGQGVVAECFGLSGLKGHRTGGSIHVIVNNQIGFTTDPRFSRSSPYPSDVAKMVEAPIFHVNGDDPEAVVYAAKVATEFRQKFRKPVVLDMFCYRRIGPNIGDEPAFTPPPLFKR